VENNQVYLLLPSINILNDVLGTGKYIIKRSMTSPTSSPTLAASALADRKTPVTSAGGKDSMDW